ncbi:sensor histidine kinase [Oceaniglobus roseus]|uniref:sensor histidine kinase n=1 Tax=Oceaniglobus roseus TaxID=1737570 RepID=UPI000C7ECB0C|nr:HAMP domain-containing sensor histidine kinase [Kandeliimicrobium roseum]
MSRGILSLARSMPVRLACSLVALFAVVSLASLAASYAVSWNSLDATMREDLRQDMAGFRAAPSALALAALVNAEGKVTDPNRMLLSYFAPNGQHFGNAALTRDENGYHLTQPSGEGISGQYLALTDDLYGGELTIARSRTEIDDLWLVFRRIVLVSLLPTILVALSGGLWLARRSAAQVEVMENTLERLTSGNLAARVDPAPGWSEDMLQIGRRIDRMAAAQQLTVETLRQVSSDVAHDLKTPIQRVAVRLDDLTRHHGLAPEARALIDDARADLDDVVSVFHALLQIAQVESGTPKSRFAAVDLGTLAETMAELYEPAAADTGHTLTVTATPGAAVWGGRDLLGQVLANLIENALRHTPEGTAIAVTVTAEADTVRLTVADTGPGIPAAERTAVLQRLYRLDRSRHTPGSGLGLSLVSVVAGLHEAEVTLDDNAPGLVVRLTFRRCRNGAGPSSAPEIPVAAN